MMLVIKLSTMKSVARKIVLFVFFSPCEVDQKYFNNYVTNSTMDVRVICMEKQALASIDYLPNRQLRG